MALLSLLITAFFSACERLMEGETVTIVTGEGTAGKTN